VAIGGVVPRPLDRSPRLRERALGNLTEDEVEGGEAGHGGKVTPRQGGSRAIRGESRRARRQRCRTPPHTVRGRSGAGHGTQPRSGLPDRKSTRLNSSHVSISYAV